MNEEDQIELAGELTKAAVGAAAKEVIEPLSKQVSIMFTPFSKEVGLSLGYFGQYIRLKTLLKVGEMTTKLLQDRNVTPQTVPRKLLTPILEFASLEDDDAMQTRWATLLANAADPKGATILSATFPEMLKDLSGIEVYILDAVYGALIEGNMAPAMWIKVRVGVQENFFEENFDEYVLQLALENLNRLSLISWTPRFDSGKTDFNTTLLGFAFVRACHIPNPKRGTLTYHVDDDRGGTTTATIMGGVAHEHPLETSVEDFE